MIAPPIIDCIQELLAEGKLSQRKIAKKVGVSRGTVAGVAGGRRPDYEQIRHKRRQEQEPLPLGPLARCPECGGMVYMPCRLCQLRSGAPEADSPRRSPDPRPTESLGLDLRGEARARYEAVHLRRMQQGELCEQDEADPQYDPSAWNDDNDEDWPRENDPTGEPSFPMAKRESGSLTATCCCFGVGE